jgi:hypothetical protein
MKRTRTTPTTTRSTVTYGIGENKSKGAAATNNRPHFQAATNGEKGLHSMKPYHTDVFLSNSYSEDQYAGLSEREYDEAMAAFASDDFDGYSEWSAQVENLFVDASGAVHHKPEPRSAGRIGGIEL